MKLGDVIRDLREDAGMSSAELARMTGMSPSHICDVEYGRSGVSRLALEKIAEALNVPVRLLKARSGILSEKARTYLENRADVVALIELLAKLRASKDAIAQIRAEVGK